MIDIYGDWIDRYGVDGFRIDTARHVNPEFWQAFVPAMLARAKARGIPNFHIFGEVYTDARPGVHRGPHAPRRLPAVLDFAFAAAVKNCVAGERADRARWPGCSTSTRSMQAARRRRGNCRPSLAIMTWAASRAAMPRRTSHGERQTNCSSACCSAMRC